MGLFQIARPRRHDLLFAVQRHIENELYVDRLGRAEHIRVNGIVLQHPRVGTGVRHGLVAVVFVDRPFGTNAGQDALASPGKTREEMGLHKAFRHQQVAFGGQPVHLKHRAGGQSTQLDKLLRGEGVVDGDLLMIDDLVAEHAALFLLRGGTVQTGGDENGNVRVGIARANFLQQQGQGDLAGHGPGMVAGNDDDVPFAFRQRPQTGRVDGMLQRVQHQLFLTFFGMKAVHFGRQYGLEVFLLHMKSQCGCIVGDRDRPLHGRGLLCLFLGELFFYVP